MAVEEKAKRERPSVRIKNEPHTPFLLAQYSVSVATSWSAGGLRA